MKQEFNTLLRNRECEIHDHRESKAVKHKQKQKSINQHKTFTMNTLKLYGADWCPDCRRAKAYLKENNIDFEFIDVDLDEEATRLVEKINKGKRIIPTLDLNGKTFTNPDNAELADALGINNVGIVQLFGADWCPDCRRAKSYLADNGINFQFIDVDEHEWATEEVEKINNGKRIIPTILINGKPHTNPDNATLKKLLVRVCFQINNNPLVHLLSNPLR